MPLPAGGPSPRSASLRGAGGLVVVDFREGGAVGGGVLGVVEKSLHMPPAQKPRRINIEDVKPTDHT